MSKALIYKYRRGQFCCARYERWHLDRAHYFRSAGGVRPADNPLSPANTGFVPLFPTSSLRKRISSQQPDPTHSQAKNKINADTQLDAKEGIVLCDALASCGGTCFYLADSEGHDEIGDECVFRFTRAVRDHYAPSVSLRELRTAKTGTLSVARSDTIAEVPKDVRLDGF